MQHSIVSWETIHEHGQLWWLHMAMRKRLFVDEMHWDVPHTSDAEADQYDTPRTKYVISHVNGMPLAASRLNPTEGKFGIWSYMINDACKGMLDGIPSGLLDTPPQAANVWEATRFTVAPEVHPKERNSILADNAKALTCAARKLGATKLIALMSPAYVRWLSSIGLPTTKAGPTVTDGQGKRICVMEMSV
ncbi:acyl-homoserine-lactone synthase [Phaeobacter inhibens]|uniref:acyl-homoserine-lactone synthase n=1 Tax=Phaeobacter inhibens TaxID=221822 RepID=UPI0021A3AB83|nr:acyl-homoserine-lactone synthase [Phaeobacter inhibens]UWS06417.1 N-acyl-L-homoserine lactone synthetase [Phaeobacter inhibens]